MKPKSKDEKITLQELNLAVIKEMCIGYNNLFRKLPFLKLFIREPYLEREEAKEHLLKIERGDD